MNVRGAVETDVVWILSQLKDFSRFFGTKRQLFEDESHARKGLLDMLSKHLLLVAEREDGELAGFIAGYVVGHPFNPNVRVLAETFWWVPAECRRTRAGALLLNAFIEWGKAHVDWITFCMIEGKTPVKDETLTHRGFHLHERSYLMEVT